MSVKLYMVVPFLCCLTILLHLSTELSVFFYHVLFVQNTAPPFCTFVIIFLAFCMITLLL